MKISTIGTGYFGLFSGTCFSDDAKAMIKTADETGCLLEILASVENVNDKQS